MESQRIDKSYETLCLCMFHDTLPGSSIRLAVEDYDKAFAELLSNGKELLNAAVKALSSRLRDTSDFTVLNMLPGVSRRELVEIKGDYQLAEATAGSLAATLAPSQSVKGVSGRSS